MQKSLVTDSTTVYYNRYDRAEVRKLLLKRTIELLQADRIAPRTEENKLRTEEISLTGH